MGAGKWVRVIEKQAGGAESLNHVAVSVPKERFLGVERAVLEGETGGFGG